VRTRLVGLNSLFEELDTVQRASWLPFAQESAILSAPFKATIENFYMTDSISRHSISMAKCVREIAQGDRHG